MRRRARGGIMWAPKRRLAEPPTNQEKAHARAALRNR